MSDEARFTVITGSKAGRLVREPLLWLGLTLVLLAVLLSLPLSVAIGPMYWDTYLYIDAAQRIGMGQIPNVDFAAPVGPLGYYLFYWGLELFPRAQPLLLAQWCMLLVAAPLMAVVVNHVARNSRTLAFALLVPFLIFSVFPVNNRLFNSLPGFDGFGIYNRHGIILLYVLTSGLLFLEKGRKLALFCASTMLALFLTKITAFLAGGLIGLVAALAGRISIGRLVTAIGIFGFPLAVAELLSGFVSTYIASIVDLVAVNESGLLSRLLTVFSTNLDVVLPAFILCCLLFWLEFARRKQPLPFFDRSVWWLGIAVLAGSIYETQNSGSVEYVFLWPILLLIYQRIDPQNRRAMTAFVVLSAFCVIPIVSSVSLKTLRSVAVLPTYERLDAPILRNMEQIASRPDIIWQARALGEHYAVNPESYAELARRGIVSHNYADLDFQLYWLLSVADATEKLISFETENNIRLASLMSLDFTNPFPWLLGRDATRHIQIGAVPSRTMLSMTAEVRAAVDATDGVLRPKCPITSARLAIEAIYADALTDREVVQLGPCWDLLLREDIIPQE